MAKIVGHCTVGWQVNEAQMVEVVVVDEYETFTHLSSFSLHCDASCCVASSVVFSNDCYSRR